MMFHLQRADLFVNKRLKFGGDDDDDDEAALFVCGMRRVRDYRCPVVSGINGHRNFQTELCCVSVSSVLRWHL